MTRKNIERAIAKASNVPLSLLPLDVLLIEGIPIEEPEKKEQKTNKPIVVKSLNFEGTMRKTPYSPISTVFTLNF